MAVRYALIPNKLTGKPGEYRAVVRGQRSYTREELVDMMVARGSTVSKSDTLAVLAEYDAVRLDVLSQGDAINTPMVYMGPSIGGLFNGPADRFHPSRHETRMNAQPGPLARSIAGDIPVQKVSPGRRYPVLRTFRDVSTDTVNQKLTPGGTGILSGRRLKTDPEDPEQGVFLITASSGGEKEVQVANIFRNTPAELIFMIPETLESGTYRMEVRTLVRFNTAIRKSSLDTPLTVP